MNGEKSTQLYIIFRKRSLIYKRSVDDIGHVYFVGAVCQDVIMYVDEYPQEDEKVHAQKVEKRRGGNSGNSLDVLAQLTDGSGLKLYLLAALGDADVPGNTIARDLTSRGISLQLSSFRKGHDDPCSWIISAGNSRTVVNYNPLDNLTVDDFRASLGTLHPERNWFHFEGRNVEETWKMIILLRQKAQYPITISVELEKPDRPDIESLAPLADVIFYSGLFAKSRGFKNGHDFLNSDLGCKPGYFLIHSLR